MKGLKKEDGEYIFLVKGVKKKFSVSNPENFYVWDGFNYSKINQGGTYEIHAAIKSCFKKDYTEFYCFQSDQNLKVGTTCLIKAPKCDCDEYKCNTSLGQILAVHETTQIAKKSELESFRN